MSQAGDVAEMRGRLAAWDELVRADVARPERLVAPARRARSVLRPGATEEAIAATEQRLRVRLPPSYRTFLALTDGAYADTSGAMTESRARLPYGLTSGPGFGFLAVRDLTSLTHELVPGLTEFVAAWDGDDRPLARDGGMVCDLSPLLTRRVLVISAVFESDFVGLIPGDGADEWELWIFGRDEIVGFRSFGSWLRQATTTPGAEAIMDLVRRARVRVPGDVRVPVDAVEALEQIGKIRDPAALPVLHAAIEEFNDDVAVVRAVLRALIRMRNESSIPFVEPWARDSEVHNSGVAALVAIGTPAARDALVRVGAHRELWTLGDPRAGSVAERALEQDSVTAAATLSLVADESHIPALRSAWERNRGSTRGGLVLAGALYRCGAADGADLLLSIVADDRYPDWERQRAQQILDGTFPPPGLAG